MKLNGIDCIVHLYCVHGPYFKNIYINSSLMFEELVIPCFWQIKGHRNLCAGCLDKVYMTDQNMFDIVKLDCKY